MSNDLPGGDDAAGAGLNEWIATIEVAVKLGITQASEIKAFIEATDAEQLRAHLVGIVEKFERTLLKAREIGDRLNSLTTAQITVAEQHAQAQAALVGRVTILAKAATVGELQQLADAYMQLPRPYEDTFEPPRE